MGSDVFIDPEFEALIPPPSEDELAGLESSLKVDGCRDALVVWARDDGESVLLDGHNRKRICDRLDIEYRIHEIQLPSREAVKDWIDANQLSRRNLTPDQASIIRGRRYNRQKKSHGAEPGTRRVKSQTDTLQDTAATIAKQHGVSRATVIRDGKRAEALEKLKLTAPDEAKAVEHGKKRFREVERTIRREKVKAKAQLPTAKYRVIYADPPWKYGDSLTEDYGGTKFHYPSMTITELCAMPVKTMAEDDAVLFLWVTSPLLFECAPLIEAWGFSYKASFVWDKVKHNMGHYNSVRHEFLLICTRGSCTPDNVKLVDSVQSIERTKHSAKPQEFRKIIEQLYQHGKKLELFARAKSQGWDVYGNQLPD